MVVEGLAEEVEEEEAGEEDGEEEELIRKDHGLEMSSHVTSIDASETERSLVDIYVLHRCAETSGADSRLSPRYEAVMAASLIQDVSVRVDYLPGTARFSTNRKPPRIET